MLALDRLLGLADRHDDAAPVGVLARDGGLDQRAFGDRLGDPARRGRAGGAGDVDLDEFARALAVAHQLRGEVVHDLFQLGLEVGQPPVARARDARRTRSAGGEQKAGVVGRGVAVHGHRIEGGARIERQQALQHAGRQGGVGDDEGQHGRHVRRDHARPLGDPVDAHLNAVDLGGFRRALGEGVGGHDGRGGVGPGVGAQVGFELRNPGGDLRVVQHHADHPGRGQHDVALTAIDAPRQRGGGAAGGVGPGLAGEGVGAPGVDDQRAHVRACVGGQLLLAPVHGRRADRVAREHARAGRPFVEDHQQGVLALMLVEARPRRRQPRPGQRRHDGQRHGQRRDVEARLARRGRVAARRQVTGQIGDRLHGALDRLGQRVERALQPALRRADFRGGRRGVGSGRSGHERDSIGKHGR